MKTHCSKAAFLSILKAGFGGVYLAEAAAKAKPKTAKRAVRGLSVFRNLGMALFFRVFGGFQSYATGVK